MPKPPVIESPLEKKRSVSRMVRKASVPLLHATGLGAGEIAKELGVSRATITTDLREGKAVEQQVTDVLTRAQARLEQIWPVEARIERLVDVGQNSKMDTAVLAAISMGNDISGIVTDKERIRAKGQEPQAIVPMFSLPAGVNVSVGVVITQHAGPTTSCDDMLTNDAPPRKSLI